MWQLILACTMVEMSDRESPSLRHQYVGQDVFSTPNTNDPQRHPHNNKGADVTSEHDRPSAQELLTPQLGGLRYVVVVSLHLRAEKI